MCLTPVAVYDTDSRVTRYVPCRHCPECLASQRLAWSTRIHREIVSHPNPTYFFTLTYDENHIPTQGGVPCVSEEDIRSFCKAVVTSFRKKYNHRLRYFFISEYGPETARPHYHGFFFNWPQSQRLAYRFVLNIWKKGNVTIRRADPEGGVYAVKDMVAPHNTPDGAAPGVLVRSVRPAIGCINLGINDTLEYDDFRQLRFRDVSGKLLPIPEIFLKKIFDPDIVKYMRYQQKLQPNFESLISRDYGNQLQDKGVDLRFIPFEIDQKIESCWRRMKDKRLDQYETKKELWQTT